jgi:hypothetical protein
VIMIQPTTIETTPCLVPQDITCGRYFVGIGGYYFITALRDHASVLAGVLCVVKSNTSYADYICLPLRPYVRDLVSATSFS